MVALSHVVFLFLVSCIWVLGKRLGLSIWGVCEAGRGKPGNQCCVWSEQVANRVTVGVCSNAFFHGTVCTLYLAMGVGQRGRGMCLFVFYAPPVYLEPRRSNQAARLMMEKDLCLHAPHGLTSTKQSQPSQRETRAPRYLSNQTGSSKGVFPPHFLLLQNGHLDSLYGHRKSV